MKSSFRPDWAKRTCFVGVRVALRHLPFSLVKPMDSRIALALALVIARAIALALALALAKTIFSPVKPL